VRPPAVGADHIKPRPGGARRAGARVLRDANPLAQLAHPVRPQSKRPALSSPRPPCEAGASSTAANSIRRSRSRKTQRVSGCWMIAVPRRISPCREPESSVCPRGHAGAGGSLGASRRRSVESTARDGCTCCTKRESEASSTLPAGTPVTKHQSVQRSGSAVVILLILPPSPSEGPVRTVSASRDGYLPPWPDKRTYQGAAGKWHTTVLLRARVGRAVPASGPRAHLVRWCADQTISIRERGTDNQKRERVTAWQRPHLGLIP